MESRLTVARTYRTFRRNIGGTDLAAALRRSLLTPPRYSTEHETLKTDEKTWEDLDEEDSYVKSGDPVREILDAEAEAEPG